MTETDLAVVREIGLRHSIPSATVFVCVNLERIASSGCRLPATFCNEMKSLIVGLWNRPDVAAEFRNSFGVSLGFLMIRDQQLGFCFARRITHVRREISTHPISQQFRKNLSRIAYKVAYDSGLPGGMT